MSFAQDLRASVLQAAMQGKLTEQLATDTPVSELLAEIKAEKDRLFAEKKIKKEKPLSAISEDDMPFDIPESWEWVRFGDIVYYNMGKTPPRAEPEWWKNDCPWVSIADMPENGHISKTKEMVSQKAIDEKFSKISPAGTMLMSFKLTVGRVSILDIDAVHNEAIISIYPHCDRENIIQKYLFMLLPYVANAGNTKNAIKGKTLNNDSIRNLLIPYPPIEEQKRIVRRIEEIMTLIDELEAIEEELKKLKESFPGDMKNAILQAAMQGKLSEPLDTDSSVDALLENIKKEREKLVKEGKIKKTKLHHDSIVSVEDEPFEIPSSWKWVNLEMLAYTNGGYAFKSSNFCERGVRVIRISDFNNNGLLHNQIIRHNYSPELAQYLIKDNDILMCMTGGTVGKCCVISHPEEKMVTNQRVANITSILILPKYLHYVLKSSIAQDIIKQKKNSTNDNISMDLILSFPIPLPPIEEQQRIVDKLETVLHFIEVI